MMSNLKLSRIAAVLSLGLLLALSALHAASAQMQDPIDWSFSVEQADPKGEVVFVAEAQLDEGWHIYSQYLPPADMRPQPTAFTFDTASGLQPIDSVAEMGPHKETSFDPNFEMELTWFSERAEYRQRFRLTGATDSITGNVYFMVCDDRQCLPPTQKNFTVAVPASVQQSSQESGSIGSAGTRWGVLFGKGFLGGLLALLTPCVFPMIPLTVSFFTKQGGSRMAAARDAGIYGLSIILIYVSLGLLVTALFGADALNAMASNGIFNMAFFLLLLVFAISFFGAFEITLPHQLVNKVQSQTSKGGFIGIFFMAFTLALVSFSCTGPIIGALLVDAASDGSTLAPFLGMAGFASALALPFSLFALFPSWLKSLPKSGGWLNSVKVVLGFLELGFSLKFLSNVDLAYHWNWLDREVFLSLWIIISALLGLYLLGKLRLPHDPPVERLPVPRLLLAIVALSFSVYLVPGLWGAPLKAVSGFLPPQGSQDFDLSRLEYMVGNQSGGGTSQLAGDAAQEARKHADKFECPHNLNCFFDYQEGMAYARKHDMPVFLDFTGHTCVNCRKMEASVWSHPQVHNYLKNKYVLISLYVDDKTKLPKEERYTSDFSGKRVTTLGGKWSDIQASRFGANSQPYYVLLNHQGNKLAPARGYNQDVQAYLDFLEKGLQQFKASQANTADVGEDTETSSFRF